MNTPITTSDSSSTPMAEVMDTIVTALDVIVAMVADLTGAWFADVRLPNIPRRVLPEADERTSAAVVKGPTPPTPVGAGGPFVPYTAADLEEAFVAHELAMLGSDRPGLLLGEAADIVDENGDF